MLPPKELINPPTSEQPIHTTEDNVQFVHDIESKIEKEIENQLTAAIEQNHQVTPVTEHTNIQPQIDQHLPQPAPKVLPAKTLKNHIAEFLNDIKENIDPFKLGKVRNTQSKYFLDEWEHRQEMKNPDSKLVEVGTKQ